MKMVDGDMPLKAQKLVEEWMHLYQEDLIKMWDEQNMGQLPPL
jgi:hypothetical protein